MSLLVALGVALLGHDAARPKRRALFVLIFLLSGALGCGWALQETIRAAAFPPLERTVVFFACIFMTSASISLSILMSYVGFRLSDTSSRLLWYLPLRPLRRWFYLQVPFYFGGFITLMTIVPSLYWLTHSLGLPSFYFYVAIFFGMSSSYGLFYACHSSWVALQAICLGIGTTIEFCCLQQLAHSPESSIWRALLTTLYIGKCLGWILCSRLAKTAHTFKSTTSMAGQRLPSSFWYAKKVLRTSLLNGSICFMLCLGIAIYFERLPIRDAEIVGTIASLIIASFAADLRGLCRAKWPAEITTLKGVRYFTECHLLTATLSCAAILPLLVLLVVLQSPLLCYLQLLLGITAGSLAGVCLVPRARDISGQCFAVLLGIALVILPPKFFTTIDHTLLLLCEICALTALIFFIEYLRNPFVWRKL